MGRITKRDSRGIETNRLSSNYNIRNTKKRGDRAIKNTGVVRIAHTIDGKPVYIDVDRLIETRLLKVASSGFGKSHDIRKTCEITYGLCQHIIIDSEGEFSSLREKYDYLLVGEKGVADIEIGVKIAETLAQKVLETNVNVIIDLYALLKREEKFDFLIRFIKELNNIKKELWNRKTLVIIDEAHKWAPQEIKKGASREFESRAEIITLAEAGRKRGLCLVLATQRLSKLDKDIVAECQNKMMGGMNLADDRKRGAEEMGNKNQQYIDHFKNMERGHFDVTGPAFIIDDKPVNDPVEVVVEKAITPHGREINDVKYIPPKSENIARVLESAFKDLPQEAERELKTKQDLEAKIAQLTAELRKREQSVKVVHTGPTEEQVIAAKQEGYQKGWIDCWGEWNRFVAAVPNDLGKMADKVDELIGIRTTLDDLRKSFIEKLPLTHPPLPSPAPHPSPQKKSERVAKPLIVSTPVNRTLTGTFDKIYQADVKLSPAMLDLLAFLASIPNRSFPKAMAFQAAGISAKSSLRGTAIKTLTDAGLILTSGEEVQVNYGNFDKVIKILGPRYKDKSTMSLDGWESNLKGSAFKIFRALREYPDRKLTKEDISITTGISLTSSGLQSGLSELMAYGLVEKADDGYKISRQVMEMTI